MNKIIFYVLWTIGVDYDIRELNLSGINRYRFDVLFTACVMCMYPVLAAMLSSAIVGFVANYVLQQKLQLKCNDDMKDDDLCVDDQLCCEVVSSYGI